MFFGITIPKFHRNRSVLRYVIGCGYFTVICYRSIPTSHILEERSDFSLFCKTSTSATVEFGNICLFKDMNFSELFQTLALLSLVRIINHMIIFYSYFPCPSSFLDVHQAFWMSIKLFGCPSSFFDVHQAFLMSIKLF